MAENPSQSYNPLFLYGGVGLGKTHLLHAIGHEILRTRPQLRVLYLAAEQFVNELINSIRFDRMPDFRERYRTIDVLLIDDVQFLANKERTQEEFFHTFNTLYTSQKQIILSSDSSPRNIPTLEERLRSRFEWGLIADIQPPDLETKVAILQRKAYLENVHLPEEVADFIAHQVKSNIRELEGLLNRVIAFSSLTGKPLSPALARETLKDILPEEGKKPAANDIVKHVARHYGLKVADIKSKSNARQIVFPRQVAMYLLQEADGSFLPGDRQTFQRQAPLDRHVLGREGRRAARRPTRISTASCRRSSSISCSFSFSGARRGLRHPFRQLGDSLIRANFAGIALAFTERALPSPERLWRTPPEPLWSGLRIFSALRAFLRFPPQVRPQLLRRPGRKSNSSDFQRLKALFRISAGTYSYYGYAIFRCLLEERRGNGNPPQSQ